MTTTTTRQDKKKRQQRAENACEKVVALKEQGNNKEVKETKVR